MNRGRRPHWKSTEQLLTEAVSVEAQEKIRSMSLRPLFNVFTFYLSSC